MSIFQKLLGSGDIVSKGIELIDSFHIRLRQKLLKLRQKLRLIFLKATHLLKLLKDTLL